MRPKIPLLLLSLALALSFCVPASLAAPLPDAEPLLFEADPEPPPSPEDAALDEAQELLAWAYNLNPATLSLFRLHAEQSADGTWRITYTGELPYPEPLGDYTVVLPPDAPPDVSWSHDDIDPAVWNTGLLSAPVWGQAQLAQAYDAIVHRQPATIQPLTWRAIPPADAPKHAFFPVDGQYRPYVTAQPGPTDLSEARALALARQAVLDTYGLDAEALSAYAGSAAFVAPEEGGTPFYVCVFLRDAPGLEAFTLHIASPSGDTLRAAWMGAPRLRPLPEGPLAGHAQAVMEFLRDGSLFYHNAARKADIVHRMYQAGYGEALPHTDAYDFPGPADLTEEEALAVARAALERAFAFPDEAFVLFDPYTSLLAYPDNRQWVVDFRHRDFWEPGLGGVAHALGTYQVTLTADTGEVLSATWDKAGQDTGIAYTQETWGALYNAANAEGILPARVLSWVTALYQQLSAISARYPLGAGIPDYSAEDAAATDTLLRAAGFPRAQFSLAAPDGSGVPLGVAAFRARTVLLRNLGVPRAVVDAAALEVAYSVGEVTGPSWVFTFHLKDGAGYAIYIIGVDAATGGLLSTHWTY